MLAEPKCVVRLCRHFVGVKQPNNSEVGERCICAAFPDGIPDEIAYSNNPHIEEFPGDNNIRYEMDTG